MKQDNMRELSKVTPDQKEEVSEVRPIKKELAYRGTLKLRKGLTCFEINTIQKTVEIASFETTVNPVTKKVTRKLITKKGCLYIVTLNKANAIRKANKKLNNNQKINSK